MAAEAEEPGTPLHTRFNNLTLLVEHAPHLAQKWVRPLSTVHRVWVVTEELTQDRLLSMDRFLAIFPQVQQATNSPAAETA